jgi:hypothetical protein
MRRPDLSIPCRGRGIGVGVLWLVSCSVLHGAGLPYLASHASAIVVGSVDGRTEGPTEVSFSLNVVEVLSGVVPGSPAKVVHPWTGKTRKLSSVL